jgi:hypothetical protein
MTSKISKCALSGQVYEDAQAAKIALGMPEVQPITAAA